MEMELRQDGKTFKVEINEERFRELLGDADGHGIYDPELFTAVGFPMEFLPVTHIKSNLKSGDPKKILYKNGKPIKETIGVSELDFWRELAKAIGADTKMGDKMFGRGSAAREYAHAIREKLNLK